MNQGASAAETATATPDQEATIRRAIDAANSNALRTALYQLTRDPELTTMRLVLSPVRGGALMQKLVAEGDLPRLKEKAFRFLLNPPAKIPPPPTREEARELLAVFSNNEPLSDNYARVAFEELAFDDFPRDIRWTKKPSAETLKAIHVLVIGGGISGIAASAQLGRLGIPYTVIERQPEVGGVWQINNYPDARVDTSAYTYQYKFEKNYRWREFFPSRNETKRYLQHVAEKHGVLPHIQFSSEVVSAKWDEERALWVAVVRGPDGAENEILANFIISAGGLFAKPNIPDIPGIETFRGRMFHTTHWDHSVDLKGKRIAVIGTGSTGTQLMPALARVAGQLTVYQRTANWIAGVDGLHSPVPPELQFLFDHIPYYWNWFCYSSFNTAYQLQNAQAYDEEWRSNHGGVSQANETVKAALMAYLDRKLGSRPDLLEKCTPNHVPLARRLVVDNGFYDALLKPNVELVTEGIERVTPHGIVSKEGKERPFDMIVLGAGFKVSEYLWPVEYEGRDGLTPKEAWKKDGARAYLGMTMPGFPNFFMMYGPNGQPRSGGFYSWAEGWARYSAGVIVQVLENGKRTAEVKRQVFEEYNARMDEVMKTIVWESDPSGYYNNEFGRCGVNVPFRSDDYHAMIAQPNIDDYEVRGDRANPGGT